MHYAIWIALFLSFTAGASDKSPELLKVEEIFEQRFFANYEARRCGDNVRKLIHAVADAGLPLDRMQMLEFTNTGFSVFGLVNGELARRMGARVPESSLARMFLNEREDPEALWKFVGRDRKLNEYRVTVHPASEYALERRSGVRIDHQDVVMTLREYLQASASCQQKGTIPGLNAEDSLLMVVCP